MTSAGLYASLELPQTDNHASTQFFYRPDALPAAQPTVSKHWRHINELCKNNHNADWGKDLCRPKEPHVNLPPNGLVCKDLTDRHIQTDHSKTSEAADCIQLVLQCGLNSSNEHSSQLNKPLLRCLLLIESFCSKWLTIRLMLWRSWLSTLW